MERNIFDLDLPKLFLMLKNNMEAYKRMEENFEELRRTIMQLAKPSFGEILHIKDVADLLDVTPNTIYRYISNGELTSIKIRNRHVFYRKDIQAFLDKNYNGRGIK